MKLAPKSYTKPVLYNEDGEAYIDIPEICQELGWHEGDVIEWIDNKDGTYTIQKKETDTELVVVETIQMFRHRYVVQVPKGKALWALDTVTCEEAHEFSQEWLGETISSHRTITEEEYFRLFSEDNGYLDSWTDERKLSYVTKVNSNGVVDHDE